MKFGIEVNRCSVCELRKECKNAGLGNLQSIDNRGF